VNEVSDSISIVSVSQRIVTDTIYVKDEPADVVFAGGRAFVSASRKNAIAVFDATTHSFVTNLAVSAKTPAPWRSTQRDQNLRRLRLVR